MTQDQHASEETTQSKRRWLQTNRVFFWIGFFVFVFIQAGAGFWMWWWLEVGQYNYYPKNFGVVDEGYLYRSARLNEHTLTPTFTTHDIDVVIDLTNHEADDPDQRAEMEAVDALGLDFYRINGLGGYGITEGNAERTIELYIEAVELLVTLRKENKRVLLHCAAGSERTGGTIAIYRLLFQNQDPNDVFKEMKRFRHDPVKNPRLVNFLNVHLPQIAAGLHQRGVLKEMPEEFPKLPNP